MRVAAGSAWAAARSIAQICVARRHGSQIPSSSTVKVAEQGKVRVNRIIGRLLLAEAGGQIKRAR